ncbi:MAG TPA: hypothetical protein P5563_05120, partial [Saprospiraceae bacterium]|nr:hypothetical protein [Saprospiraceae bacterium]
GRVVRMQTSPEVSGGSSAFESLLSAGGGYPPRKPLQTEWLFLLDQIQTARGIRSGACPP